jgi:hypothetical protein
MRANHDYGCAKIHFCNTINKGSYRFKHFDYSHFHFLKIFNIKNELFCKANCYFSFCIVKPLHFVNKMYNLHLCFRNYL